MFSSTFVASLPKFCPREQSCGQLCPQMNVIDALLYFSYCSVPYAALAAMFKQVLSFSAGSQNSLLSSRAHNRDGECKHFGSKIISQVEQITARLQITQIVREFFRKVIFQSPQDLLATVRTMLFCRRGASAHVAISFCRCI